jgi:protein-disulfide isomerase
MKNVLSNVVSVSLVLCAFAVTATAVHREFFVNAASGPPIADVSPQRVDNWGELASAGHRMGPATAPVTIVEFSDFQCPFCAKAEPALDELRHRHPNRVSILYRHFPLNGIHDQARPAALAAECAGAQGRFEQYHMALFNAQSELGKKSWADFARGAGVTDLPEFQRCIDERRFAGVVDRDQSLGEKTGLHGTPTLIVNGTMFAGALTVEQLEKLVDAA